MRKVLYFFILSICFTTQVYAFDLSVIDSLKRVLAKSEGQKRADILNELGWELKFSMPDTAMLHTQQALQLAQKIQYAKGLALANRNLAAIKIVQGKSADAALFAEKALEYIQKTNDLYQQGKILNLLGIINRDTRKFRKALDFQNRALQIFRQLNDSSEIAGNLNNLGLIYKQLGNSDAALYLYHEVYEIEIRRKDNFGIARTANNLASIYEEMKKFNDAEKMFKVSIEAAKADGIYQYEAASLHGLGLIYQNTGRLNEAVREYNKAYAINKKAGFLEYMANNLMQIALIYEKQKNYKDAFTTFEEANSIYQKINNPWKQALAINGMSIQKRELKQIPEAITLANRAFAIGDSLKDIKSLYDIHLNLYKIFKGVSSNTEALKHLEAFVILEDSIQKNEQNELLEEIQTRYEVKTIESENARLMSENQYQFEVIRNQRIVTAGIVSILLMISVLAIVVLSGRKKLKQANKELKSRNEEVLKQSELLRDSNATKDKLFSIIGHDIRNPFSSVLNLSELLNEEIETADQATLKFYAESIYQASTVTFQLLDNLLYWSKSQRGAIDINPQVFTLSDLTNEVLNTAKAGAMVNDLKLINKTDAELQINTDKTLLRIILGNLVGNAVKFNKPGGEVVVSCQKQPDGYFISVADNGKGIEPEHIKYLFNKEESFQPHNSHVKSGTGLGLILCGEFVEKLGGHIQVESEVGKGAVFSFTLPL
ncbi:MAG: tetratricopeptide repeat-containing sensor histidine kinase [Lentimicrobiaceae bacterium]|nr:tetratricopeptide repeat-containing sensor histidine kinase [Lentimicrobiaceae bacterium]HPG32234.1 tetratricopeptide repeat-containing sensor histidine kinase [Lentimicrobium sp.]